MKELITELRLEIDSLHQLVIALEPFKGKPIPNAFIDNKKLGSSEDGTVISFEIYEADKSLLLAKAWLGKVLGALGNENPYKNNGNRHTLEDIEPTSDKIETKQWTGLNHIEKVDYIREEIQKVIDKLKAIEFTDGLDFGDEKNQEKEESLLEQANECNYLGYASYQHLTEARFHLGFELERIRN